MHPELDEHSRLVEGRDPAPTDDRLGGYAVFEFVLTARSADELGLEIGDRILLGPDPTDLVTRQFNGGLPAPFVARLVGLRELADEDDPYWSGDVRLHRPTVADTNLGANVFAFAMVTPAQMPTRPGRVGGVGPFALEQRRDLIPGSVELGTVDETLDGLVALSTAFAEQPTLTRPGVHAGLAPVLAVEVAQQESAEGALVLASVGVLGVVVAALGQLLVVSFARRRGWLTVARARGASRRQVVVGSTVEMAVVAGFAIAVGAAAALLVVRSGGSATEWWLAGGLWVGAMVVAGAIAASEGFRPVTVSARPTPHPGLGRWGRIGGTVLVVLAGAALVTFRRRGIESGRDVDLLVVAVPVLVPLATVWLTRWVLPAVTRRVGRRGLAMSPGRLVGLRRVADAPEATTGVVTVLVLALTVAALGLGVDRSIDEGAVDASWVVAGAPYRMSTREESVAARVDSIPGALVAASGGTRINVERRDTTYNVQLTTIDVDAIDEMTGGTAADPRLPAELAEFDSEGRVRVIASERMSGERIRAGDVLTGVGSRQAETYLVVETRPEAFGRRNDWILADRSVVAEARGGEPTFDTLAIDVPDAGVQELRSIAVDAEEELVERTAVLELQRTDPLGRAVRDGYLLASALAIGLALLALVSIAIVTSRQRRREVAILALLGADRREVGRAVAAELVPAALTGVVSGTLVGWLVVRLFDGRFDLSPFAGGSPVAIRPAATAAVLVAIALGVVCVVLIVGLVRRIVGAPVGEILRIDGAA